MIEPLYWLSLCGAFAFALSGVVLGVRRNFDLLGLFILSFITAYGGGVLRDILLNKPVSLLTNSEPFSVTSIALFSGYLLKRFNKHDFEENFLFILFDAIGLVGAAMVGALMAMSIGLPLYSTLVISFLAAVGGGILRDILLNDVPELFKSGFYGSVALIAALILYILKIYAFINPLSLLVVFVACILLRLVAYYGKWHLPKL